MHGVWAEAHLSNLRLLIVVLDDGHRLVMVGLESLLDAFDVIVLSSAGLSALQQAPLQLFLCCDKEQHHSCLAHLRTMLTDCTVEG